MGINLTWITKNRFFFLSFLAAPKVFNRFENYVYQILSKSTGGYYLLEQYDLECDPDYRKKLNENHVKEYFSEKKVAFFVIHYELQQSNCNT